MKTFRRLLESDKDLPEHEVLSHLVAGNALHTQAQKELKKNGMTRMYHQLMQHHHGHFLIHAEERYKKSKASQRLNYFDQVEFHHQGVIKHRAAGSKFLYN